MFTNTGHEGGLNATQDFFNPNGYVPANLLFTSALTRIATPNFDAAAGAIQPQAMSAQPATPDYTVTQTTDGSGNQVTTYAMNAGGSVQITDLANATQVVVTGAGAGDTYTYSLAANAQVVFGENQSISAGSAANEILIGGTGATLNNSTSATGILLIALGAGVQINDGVGAPQGTANWQNSIAVANTNATITAPNGDNVWIGGNETADINANYGTSYLSVTLGGSDTISVSSGNTRISSSNGMDQLNFADTNGRATGSNIVNASHETIAIGTNGAIVVNGASNSITGADAATVTANGTSNSINVTGSGASIVLENNIGGSGADSVTASGGTISIFGGSPSSTLQGDGNNITFYGSNSNLTISGATSVGDTITETASNASGNTIAVMQGITATVTGTGYNINVDGSGVNLTLKNTGNVGTGPDIVNASNTTINLVSVSASVYGGGNKFSNNGVVSLGTLNLYDTNGNADTFDGSGGSFNLNGNIQLSITGGNSVIGTTGGGNSVSIFSAAGAFNNYNGSNDTITLGSGTGVYFYGTNDVITALGSGAYASLNYANGGTEQFTGSNDTVRLTSNMNVTIAGGGNTVTETGSTNTIALLGTNGTADSLTVNFDVINLGAGTRANIVGGHNTISAVGTGSTITLSDTSSIDGVFTTFTGSGDMINVAGNTQVTINGGGNIVSDTGTIDEITLANTNGNADTFNGGNDSVTLNGHTQANIVGDAINIDVSAGSNSIALSGATTFQDSIVGSNNTIALAANTHVNISGGGNTISAAGSGSIVDMVSAPDTAPNIFVGNNDTLTVGPVSEAIVYGGGNLVHTSSTGNGMNFNVTTSASFLANQQELYRIYQAVLGRAPDADGFQYWVNQLQNGTSDASIVAGFMGSSEFQAKYGSLDNTGFVTALYQNVLGRQPDSSGLQYWVNALNNGLGRPQLVLNFANSSEFESSSAAAVQAYITGSRFASLSAGATQQFGDIYRLYAAGLGRAPDTSGLYYWSHEIQNGTPESNIAQGFVNSSEFQQLYPTSETNTQFVTQLYQNILGRQPDSAGLQYWVNALNGGMSRAALLTTLADSSEYQGKTAAAETAFMNGALYGYWQT